MFVVLKSPEKVLKFALRHLSVNPALGNGDECHPADPSRVWEDLALTLPYFELCLCLQMVQTIRQSLAASTMPFYLHTPSECLSGIVWFFSLLMYDIVLEQFQCLWSMFVAIIENRNVANSVQYSGHCTSSIATFNSTVNSVSFWQEFVKWGSEMFEDRFLGLWDSVQFVASVKHYFCCNVTTTTAVMLPLLLL